MIPFVPSAAFVAFFNTVIAAAEAPVVQGSYSIAIPTFADPREQAFANTKLAALIAQIDAMRKSVTPVLAPITPQVQAYIDQGMTQTEAQLTAEWFANMSTP